MKGQNSMKNIEKLTEQFKLLFEKFLIGCDSIEEIGQWNKEELGEMDVFYTNDLAGVAIRLIASDGIIGDEEVRYLNENFGFGYSAERLTDIYNECKDEIDKSFDENFVNGITYMRSINTKLADAYKELLGLICDIVIESDTVISDAEIQTLNRLKSKL